MYDQKLGDEIQSECIVGRVETFRSVAVPCFWRVASYEDIYYVNLLNTPRITLTDARFYVCCVVGGWSEVT